MRLIGLRTISHNYEVSMSDFLNEYTFEDWLERFDPIQNHLVDNSSVDGYLFMNYGREWGFVKEFANKNIWSLIITDLENGSTSWDIVSGVHVVNRAGFLVTRVAWVKDSITTY